MLTQALEFGAARAHPLGPARRIHAMSETTPNPLLADPVLPEFGAIRPEHVEPAISALLADYQASIDRLTADPAARTWDTLMRPLEELEDRLDRAWSPVDHLHSVADSRELREVYGEALEAITDFSSALGQNRALYEAVTALRDSPGYPTLARAQRTIVDDSLRDFRLAGVALEEPARTRYREVQAELSRLGTEFDQAVMDSTEAWTLDFADAAPLAGLPESDLALMRRNAEEAGIAGYRVTLRQPSVVAVMTWADDRALRSRMYEANATRASDQGPNAGRFDNGPRIERILALKHEAANLLGFANAAEESLATKMAATPARVMDFIADLVARAKPPAERELADLREFARTQLGIADLQPWDTAYAAEKLRQHRYALSEEELKPYFSAERAIEGVFALAQRLFGVRFARREGVPVWHPDVRWYDVLDADGSVRAGAYLDLYARAGKRPGAWMDVCRARRRHRDGLQRPVAFLTCNFAPPTANAPSLLTHDDVTTLFHEFGHGLHHLLTEVDWPGVAGISGVEWDAVELPSQFLENFAWRREVLDLFAHHHVTGEVLPDDLFRRLSATRHFHAALALVRQLEFGLFDFRIHLEYDPAHGARTLALLDEVRRLVSVLPPPAWNRMPWTFTHIFSGGYDAGYYSYLWAEVLSADAFGRFEEAGVLDPAAGDAFRRSVLAVGGSRPALESFVEFRGREPDPAALLRSYGLAA
jgi:oligopeptidase A